MFQRILCVCVGNICRSPTAEIVLRHYLPMATVTSAGLHARVGQPIDATAREVLQAHGLDAGAHVASQLDVDMMHAADLILVMQQAHRRTIALQAPQAVGRTMLLGKWRDDAEISDPFGQQRPAFEHVYQLIEASVKAWIPYLKPGD